MRVLGLIPARAGSKGIPGKNTRPLAGKPLIAYTIEQALAAAGLAAVMVSTEDQDIASIAQHLGAEVPFLRSPELAADDTPTVPVILEVLREYEKRQHRFDAVCLLQPTTPFRPSGLIDRAIAEFADSGADSLISVRPVPHEFNPHWVFEPDPTSGYLKLATGERSIIPRRQELPPAFHRDGAIYLVRTDLLIRSETLYGESIAFVVNDSPDFVNLDTMDDWHRAERIALNQLRQSSQKALP